MTQPGSFPAVGKGFVLPNRAIIVIPAGLDSTIKRLMASVIRLDMAGFPLPGVPAEDLFYLGLALGTAELSDAYSVTLYGHEVKTLHTFLYDQRTRLNAVIIGMESGKWNEFRARVVGFLTQLEQVGRGVDTARKRPVAGES